MAAAHRPPPPAPPAEKKGRQLPFPFGSALFRAVNVKMSLTLLALTFGLIWYMQEQEKTLLHTTQVVRVERIIDGDTFVGIIAPSANPVLPGKSFRFRLRLIDAPERDQPFGQEATQALETLLISPANDREVVCRIWEKDTWGRFIADVYTRDNIERSVTPVQRELVAMGMAWTFGGLSKDRGFAQIEEEARKARRGLWAQEHPVEPWKHRRAARGGGNSHSHSHSRRHGQHEQSPHPQRSSSLREQHDANTRRSLNQQQKKKTHTRHPAG